MLSSYWPLASSLELYLNTMSTHTKTIIALVGIIVGVVVSEKTVYGSEIAIASLILGVVQIGIYFVEKYFNTRKYHELKTNNEAIRFSIPLVSGIFFIALFLIVLRVQLSVEKSSFVCEKACSFNATIFTTPEIKNEYQIFSVQPDTSGDSYDILVRVPLYPRFKVGEKVMLTGKVTSPYIVMPHDGSKTFDYEMYLRTRNIGSEMFYPKIVVLVSGTEGYSFITKLRQVKERSIEIISSYINEPAASLASGMLFGASSMSKELIQTFRVAGISHIVVLSGFNVAILISFVLLILVFVPLFLRILLAGIFVVLFVLMVGGEASIVRAAGMSFIGLLALLIGRAYVARQALLLSLVAIIFYEPVHLLHDVSLHLSFLATAGIIYMSDGVKNILQKVQSKTYQEIITTTVCAYVATLPYVIYTFGTVSVYALVANFIVLPFVPIMMLLTFLLTILAPLLYLPALAIGYVDTLLGNFIIFVARTVEHLPFASLTISFSFAMMCAGYGVLAAGYIFLSWIHTRKLKNETSLTKSDEILSEIISY